MRDSKGILVRGGVAGAAGAAMLSLWFLLVDMAAGVPFRTPLLVASGFFGIAADSGVAGVVALFSGLHLFLFILLGSLVGWGMSQVERAPNVALGLVVGFALFVGSFYGDGLVGIDLVAELGWAEVLVGNVLAGIVLVAVLHQTGITGRVQWWTALQERVVLREGLWAGFSSGFMVATWFLIVDTIQGRPFFTPSVLGSALFLGASDLSQVEISLWITAAYTPVHYGIIVPFGIAAAALAVEAEEQPPLLIGGILFFVAFEAFFLGIIAVAAEFILGSLAWWNIAIGNLVGVLTMVGYLWKKHPKLIRSLGTETIERSA